MNPIYDDLRKKGFVPDGQGGWHKPSALVAAGLSHPKPQHDAWKALDRATSHEAGSRPRILLRITRHSRKTLDMDNGFGGAKFICDVLRYRGIIRDDNPQEIDFQFRQVKVRTKEEEGTLIEIFPEIAS